MAGEMDKLLKRLKALSEEKRLQIVHILRECESCCVSELVERLGYDQPCVSHCLAILRRAGLVRSRREGKYVHYSLDRESLEEVKEMLFES